MKVSYSKQYITSTKMQTTPK